MKAQKYLEESTAKIIILTEEEIKDNIHSWKNNSDHEWEPLMLLNTSH